MKPLTSTMCSRRNTTSHIYSRHGRNVFDGCQTLTFEKKPPIEWGVLDRRCHFQANFSQFQASVVRHTRTVRTAAGHPAGILIAEANLASILESTAGTIERLSIARLSHWLPSKADPHHCVNWPPVGLSIALGDSATFPRVAGTVERLPIARLSHWLRSHAVPAPMREQAPGPPIDRARRFSHFSPE